MRNGFLYDQSRGLFQLCMQRLAWSVVSGLLISLEEWWSLLIWGIGRGGRGRSERISGGRNLLLLRRGMYRRLRGLSPGFRVAVLGEGIWSRGWVFVWVLLKLLPPWAEGELVFVLVVQHGGRIEEA